MQAAQVLIAAIVSRLKLLVSYRGADVMVDCGQDWLGKFERLGPSVAKLRAMVEEWGIESPLPTMECSWNCIASIVA